MNSVLVIGAGSIGRRHIQCLKESGVANIYVCEPVESNRSLVQNMFDIRGIFADPAEALRNDYDGVIICVPNHLHADIAVPVIERKLPILLEKPVEISMEAAHRILNAVNKHGVVCQVGYCLRFSSVMEQIHTILNSGELGKILCADVTVGQYLPDWRPGADYRTIYSAIKKQGGGVCLDISHELDYFRWFFGEPKQIQSYCNRISNLEIDTEDVVESIIYTESGVLGRIHLEYLSRALRRQLHITLENGNIYFDFVTGVFQVYKAGEEFWKYRVVNEDRNAMFRKQFKHFTNCVQNSSKPLVDVEDAAKTLEFVLKIRESGSVHLTV